MATFEEFRKSFPEEKIKRLNALGFVWDVLEFQTLVKIFKEELVPGAGISAYFSPIKVTIYQ